MADFLQILRECFKSAREDDVGSSFFQSYVANINRVHLIELIEAYHYQRSPRPFRASLIVNPVTGLPYGDASEDATRES